MNDYAGRPHWGKLHFQSSHTLARTAIRSGRRSATVRAKLDPSGTFRNPYLDRVLGAPSIAPNILSGSSAGRTDRKNFGSGIRCGATMCRATSPYRVNRSGVSSAAL